MSDNPYNPNDPAFLASRVLDGDLSEAERQRLDEALAASDKLQAEAEGLRKVDRLIKQWGAGSSELDWDAYTKLVHARVSDETDEADLREVDDLVARWGCEPVEIDDARFTAAVMARVRPSVDQRLWPRLIFRIGTPLAAAAAVAIVVTASLWSGSSSVPIVTVRYGPPAQVVSAGAPNPSAVVMFDRAQSPKGIGASEPPSISMLALGSSPIALEDGGWSGSPL